MPTTYPLPKLSASVTAAGITAPPFVDIYNSLIASYQSIFGTDSYITPDSQDGQLLAIVAKAIADANDTSIAVYNSFSPQTAQGVGLSSRVKMNGLARLIPTNSQANVNLVGQVGSIISNGVVADEAGNLWDLPASVVIPLAGTILVTATAQQTGAINAAVGAINKVQTPTLGWQSVSNPTVATPGNPVESDADLRRRQAASVALTSLDTIESIVANLLVLPGVTQVKPYENDTNTTDAKGLPPHSISMVVLGGVAADIAEVIATKKTPGAATYGTTSIPVTASVGVTRLINFYIPTPKTIKVEVEIHPMTTAYTSAVGDSVRQAVVDYINSLTPGDDVERSRLYLPAQLYGASQAQSYNVTNLRLSISPAALGTADLTLAFNELAVTTLVDVTLVVA